MFVPTLSESLKYVLFYVVCAGIFCAGIYASKGGEAASAWANGYLLEWMLSLDNLIVFRMVFDIYGTKTVSI